MATEQTETLEPPAATAIEAAALSIAAASEREAGPVSEGGTALPAAAEDAVAVSRVEPLGLSRPFVERRPIMSLPLLSFLIVVALPVAIAGIYYLFVAADQYVVEFRFGVRSVEPLSIGLGGLFGSLAPSPIAADSSAVVQYVESRAVTDDLGKTLDLQAIFSHPEADWFARLHPPLPVEELVRYWRGQVDAFYDATDRSITVTVRAFTPRDSLLVARGVLAAAERLVNDLSARARHDTLAHAQQDLGNAERRLDNVLLRLRAFRDTEGVIDPRQTANATEARAGRLRDELVQAQTELAQLEHYMSGDAPALSLLRARIKALTAEERSVAGEITSAEQSRARILSRLMTSYEELESERHFAETAYQHALQALDRARRDADRQQVYLATFVRPSLPEEALYPRRLLSIGVVFLAAFAIWAIGGLVVQSIRDHL
jgi:capsular polysaccharide transport system permease protein